MIARALLRWSARPASVAAWALLACGLTAVPARSEPPPPPDVAASGRVEFLPDTDGASRVRVGHALRLIAPLAKRWTLDVHAGARLGGGFGLERSVELARAAVRYRGATVAFSAGRVVEPSTAGRLLLDGVVLSLSTPDRAATVLTWMGHSWHPEIAWDADWELSGGAELRVRPRTPAGRASGAGFVLGGSLRGDGDLPEGRLWAGGEAAGARGQTVSARVEGGFAEGLLAPGHVPLIASVRARGPVDRRLELGAELRWEGLPRLGVPLGVPTPLELLAPSGYAVARGSAALDLGAVNVRLEGGPTLQPADDGAPRVGGIGDLSVSVAAGRFVELGLHGLGGGLGSTWAAGGGGSATLRKGPLDLGVDGSVLRFAGLDGAPAWIGEARARTAVLIAPPAPSPFSLRVQAEVAGGADRVLAAWVRGGVGLEFTAARDPRGLR